MCYQQAMECPPEEKTYGIPHIVYRHPKVPPTLVRGKPKMRRFAATLAYPLFVMAGEGGYPLAPRGDAKAKPERRCY